MGRPGRRPERLAKLTEEAGFSSHESILEISRPPLPVTTVEEADKVLATLIQSNRGLRNTTMVLKVFGQGFSQAWSHAKDRESKATTALQYMFKGDISQCSAGETLVLVRLGANVNEVFSSRNSLMARDTLTSKSVKRSSIASQSDPVDTIFERAVLSGRVDLVNVLADGASPPSLKRGLKIAISKRNLDILRILVALGADPNDCSTELDAAIDLGDHELLFAACGGKVPLNDRFLTPFLYQMLRLRKTDMVRFLLLHGADADVRTPSGLHYAVDASRVADVLSLCTAERYPAPFHLAEGVAKVYQTSTGPGDRLRLTEILLAAGADGLGVTQALLTATSKGDRAMVKLLLNYCQPDKQIASQALKTAIKKSDYFLFLVHLDLVDGQATVDETIIELLTTPLWYQVSEKHRVRMCNALIDKKPSKTALGKALSGAVGHSEVQLVRLLMERGAGDTEESANALVAAIQCGSMDLLQVLLEKDTPASRLSSAMRYATGLPTSERLAWIGLLLKYGVIQADINYALSQTIQDGSSAQTDYQLMKALLNKSGTIDVGENSCLVAAVEAVDISAIRLLSRYFPYRPEMDLAFQKTSGIRDLDKRYQVLELLLKAKPGSVAVTNTLINVLDLIPRETRFSRLLVSRGSLNINHSDGRVLVQAITHQDVELVRLLANRSPTSATLGIALRAAMTTQQGLSRLQICQILTTAGVSGVEVDQALLRATVTIPADIDLVRLFLSSAASIDYKSGSVVILAIERADMDVLTLLLDCPCQEETMSRAFEHARKLKKPEKRLVVLKALEGARTKPTSQTNPAKKFRSKGKKVAFA